MASEGYEAPTWHKFVGLGLAVLSSSFIGVSFVIKKRALLNTELKAGRLGQTPDETNLGHAYLKNPLWWVGIVMMLTGEVCNLGAYAFAPAVLVTPLGALSVVISAGLSAAILGEHLSFSAKIGMAQCVLGATILVLHAPATSATTTIASFFDRVITAGFLVWFCLNVLAVLILIFYVSPRWGHKNVIVPILICSLTGGTVVIATQGLGAAIVYSFSVADASEASQFTDWRLYFLLVYVLGSGVLQINFLNKALELFSTAVVTPIYYVCFSAATLIGSAILFKTFATVSAAAGASVIIGFFVIIGGVTLLFAFSREERQRLKLIPVPCNLPEEELLELQAQALGPHASAISLTHLQESFSLPRHRPAATSTPSSTLSAGSADKPHHRISRVSTFPLAGSFRRDPIGVSETTASEGAIHLSRIGETRNVVPAAAEPSDLSEDSSTTLPRLLSMRSAPQVGGASGDKESAPWWIIDRT